MQGSNKKQVSQKKKSSVEKVHNGQKLWKQGKFNTFTSNITIQFKCIILYWFQWIEYLNISTHLLAIPKFWHLISRLGLHLNPDANYWAGHHELPGNTILVYTQLDVQAFEPGYHLFPLLSVALTCFKFTHGIPVTPWLPPLMLGMLTGLNRLNSSVVNTEKTCTMNRLYAFIQILLQFRSIPKLLTQAKPEKKLNYLFHKDTWW